MPNHSANQFKFGPDETVTWTLWVTVVGIGLRHLLFGQLADRSRTQANIHRLHARRHRQRARLFATDEREPSGRRRNIMGIFVNGMLAATAR